MVKFFTLLCHLFFVKVLGGRATDIFITITMNSGFLGLLEPGDVPILIYKCNKVQTIKKPAEA